MQSLRLIAASVCLTWLAACMNLVGVMPASIEGTVTYRERIALTPEATFEITLEDVSRADAVAEIIARVRRKSPGQVPISFKLEYDVARIQPGHDYVLRARITEAGRLMFINDTNYQVLVPGQNAPVAMLLRRIQATTPALPAVTAAAGNRIKPPASFSGELPCADCQALRYQLDLHPDGLFVLRRSYLGKNPALSLDSIGRWGVSTDGGMLTLTGARDGAEHFAIAGSGTLRKLDAAGEPIESAHNYELARQVEFMALEPTLKLRGNYSYFADSGMFVDCGTGLRWPVATEGDNARLESAYTTARPKSGEALLVTVDGRLAQRMPMEGRGPRTTLVIDRYQGIWPTESCAMPATNAALENSYWKLTQLGATAVSVADGQNEAHFILQSADGRVAGSDGCNRILGSYSVDGHQLKLGQLAGTQMACASGMEQATAFTAALLTTASWRIEGQRLELLNAAGKLLAAFESR